MSGLVLNSASPTPDKMLDRSPSAGDTERSGEAFEEVSNREQSRLEQKEAQQERAQRRAEDERLQEKRAERVDAKERQEETARADKAEEQRRSDDAKDAKGKEADTADDDKPVAEGQADKTEKTASEDDKDGKDQKDDKRKDDAAAPMLFSMPTNVKVETTRTAAADGPSTHSSASSASQNPLQGLSLKSLAQGASGNSAQEGRSDGLGAGKSDAVSTLLGKSVAADGKALDFSAQLGRLQGDSNAQTSVPNNATGLQRGLDGRETMAPLKSYSTSIDLPVQHAEWGDKIAGKLAWLTSQRMSAAEIHVTPPDMGPLEVRVQVHHDQAQVTVHATHAAVRDQLELNGHRLRDMLQENGLNLDRFEVSADTADQGAQQQLQQEDEKGGNGSGSLAGEGEELSTDESGTLASGQLDLSWRGEVDLYA
ncbi:flagellar hook-length control protein FliK [Marinobacter halodurans]|uniref:Flagellar hook-length control protein FliK n=2 Tax=Marinobacter halodurans TaxID=2528979 RepID=A0ABY1ZSJ2_9GAMM|nr:flagellar hook-length control protein FliK [Marinobacter halodurans]